MHRTYTIRIALLATTPFLFVGLVYAQEGEVKREDSPVVEQINVRDVVRDDRSGMEVPRDSIIEVGDSADIEDKKSEAINHDASRSNNTNSKVDPSDDGGIEVQRERKRPGRVTYGNVTLERAFNSDSPYQDETQEVEATQKVFLFGLIPMQVSVVARVSKDEEIEVTQRPWYAFLFWR